MSDQFSNPDSNSPRQNGRQPSDETLVPSEMVVEDTGAAQETVAPSLPLPRVGRPWFAWLLIVAIVSTQLFLSHLSHRVADHEQQPNVENNSASIALMMQGRYLVGLAGLPMSDNKSRDIFYKQVQPLNRGPIGQRLCFIALAGELKGPSEALEHLDALLELLEQRSDKMSDRQQALCNIYERLYIDYSLEYWQAPSLNEQDRRLLESELGWFGQLALAPAQSPDHEARKETMAPAIRTVVVVIMFVMLGFVMGIAGLGGFVLFVVFYVKRKIQFRLNTGSRFGGVYAETFALWMLLFLLIGIGLTVLSWKEEMFLLQIVGSALSALALFWPLLRGVSLSRLRDDLGLRLGRPVYEIMWGVVCYVSSLPLIALGIILMFVLMSFSSSTAGPIDEFSPIDIPAHPMVYWIRDSSWWVRLQLIVLACVCAPLLEETMFRGLLYRHLREWTAHWRIFASVLFSAAVNAFVFAVIHPQGFVAVPVLMSVAIGFSLMREWRGSLIAPMTAHAMHNGMLTILMLAIL